MVRAFWRFRFDISCEYRASKTNESATPSKAPASVTRSLSTLRLEHGRLMEEHGALKALLRQKEHELSEATTQHTESQTVIEDLESRLKASEDKIGRSDRKVILAEREASFLQAMMVRLHPSLYSSN